MQILRVYKLKDTIIWDITSYSSLKVNRHFGRKYLLHLQGRKDEQETSVKAGYKQSTTCSCFNVGILLGLFFDPEEGCNMFLRNVG
jgi:hypothetical protein